MPLRKRHAALAILATVILGVAPARPAVAQNGARIWSAETSAGRFTAALETRRKGEALVLTLTPPAGARVTPPVLRVDVPRLLRDRVAGRFPAAIRSERETGPVRAVLPLKAPVRFADPDRNDGMMRVEFRHCRADPGSCAVERLDIPLRAGK